MIGVSIIDDDQETRDYLMMVIRNTPGLECVSAYSDCETALAHLGDDQSEVILLDIGFPEHRMSGTEAAWRIKQMLPEAQIIMMTIYADDKHVFEALKNGANGYLVKRVPPAELVEAIETISRGGSPMSMSIARMVTESFHRHQCFNQLSKRQRQVLELLCEGKSYKAIAQALYIDLSTVKFHIRNIYRILQVSNKAAAVRLVLQKR